MILAELHNNYLNNVVSLKLTKLLSQEQLLLSIIHPHEIMQVVYYVYVLKGPKQLYTGSTSDLQRRFIQHQEGESLATKGKGPWKLIYYEACVAKKDALLREHYLKTAWGKRYLKNRLRNGM